MVGTATDRHSQLVDGMEFLPLSAHQIKQEPLANFKSLKNVETTLRTSTMSEFDPMNLLEMLVHASADEDESEPEPDKDDAGPRRSIPSEERWQEWMQGREWLLYDGEEKRQAFCLYCGIKLAVSGYAHIKRHELSRSHEERGENYRIFQLSGQWADDSPAIKSEPGTNSGHVIMKYRRLRQTEALNNFNWERWLLAHNWLERKGKQGTKGYCKYCRLELGVEFLVDRQRHEENMKHKLAVKMYWQYKNIEPNHGEMEEQPNSSTYSAHEEAQSDGESGGADNDNGVKDSSVRGPWYEAVSDSKNFCRCRLCRVRMGKKSFYKHTKSKLHYTNMRRYKSARTGQIDYIEPEKRDIDWRRYTKIHPWLTADPSNGKFAYCTYCERRFMYGLSIVKRYLHENSASHKQAIAQRMLNPQESTRRESNADSSGVADPYEDDDDEGGNETDRMSEQNNTDEEEEGEAEGEGEQGSGNESVQQEGEDNSVAEEHAEQSDEQDATGNEQQSQHKRRYLRGSHQWFKMYPSYRKYSKNPAYIYCTICKVPLRKKFARKKHEGSTRHRLGVGMRPAATNVQKQSPRQDLTSIYPWLDYSRNKRYRCKFCRVVLSDKYSRKQHELTKRHILCAKAYLTKTDGVDATALQEPTQTQTIQEQSTQSVKMWKSRFPWITYNRKETRENYFFCQYCDQSVYVPSLKYALKHQRSSRHLRARVMLRRQHEEAKKGVPAEACEESSNGDDEEEIASNTGEINVDSFDWLMSDKDNSKKSSPAHRKVESVFLRGKKRGTGSDGDNTVDRDALADNVDASNAEPAQDSGNTVAATDPPSKRIRKTAPADSACSLASRLTSAHLEILSLMRQLKQSKMRNSNFLKTTPFSIAACLSTVEREPSIAATKQKSSAISAAAQKQANTYDLFFESMCETVKRLPPDLAAESRIKVMQVVYDMELRALQRTQKSTTNDTNNPAETPTPSASKPTTSETAAPEPTTTMPTPAAAPSAASTEGLAAKLRRIRRHSTIEFIPVNGHISPLCKET